MTKVRSKVLATVHLRGLGPRGEWGHAANAGSIECDPYHLLGRLRFDVDQCTDCDCAVLIMSRAFAGAAVFFPTEGHLNCVALFFH